MKIEKIQNKLFGKTFVSDVFICEYMPGLPPLAVKLYLYIVYAAENAIECTEDTLAMILNSESAVVNENLILLESAGLVSWQNDTVLVNDLVQKEVERNYRLRTVARPDDLCTSEREKNFAKSKVQKAISDKFFPDRCRYRGIMKSTCGLKNTVLNRMLYLCFSNTVRIIMS